MRMVEHDNVVYYIGKNAKENDKLYKHISNDSIWFHLDRGPSAHVYAISESKLTRPQLKKGAMLVRRYSKGQGRVIYIPKSKIKLIGRGTVELLADPKIA